MTYQLALAFAGAIAIILSFGRAIVQAFGEDELDPRRYGSLILLGLLGGAALTPLGSHLGW